MPVQEATSEMEQLLNASGFSVIHEELTPPREGRYKECPELHPVIMEYVREDFQGRLYWHQANAIKTALAGNNVVLATGTASGKTISFALPVFNSLLNNQESRAIFFYPTKALAGDQLKALQKMAERFGLGNTIFRFDGDVDTAGRKRAMQKGRILLCTPDVLHTTMLKRNNEADYSAFFKNLRYVIMDECHVYSGAFGSNMAFVMRRLRQVCRRKGAALQFLAASATSKDPGMHMKLLTSQDFEVVNEDQNGSPSGGRRYILADFLESEQMPSVNGIIASLIESNKRFITFCFSRRLTEQYYNELIQAYPHIEGRIMPYRSGFESGDRQGIENALREGRLCGVISTSALELGVDLPNMEYCLLIGLPPTAMSFWQRVGRVGRQPDTQGKVLIFPSDNSLDVFYRRKPEKLFERPLEELALHLDNRQLILTHFACARVESGNFDEPDFTPDIFGQDFVELAENINNLDIVEDVLTSNDPHGYVGIRGIGDPTYEIVTTGGERPLGTITWSQILKEAYPNAVYRHMGEAYRVDKIISRDCLIKVKRENKKASTSPVGYISVKERTGLGGTVFRKAIWSDLVEMYHTTVAVTTLTSGYKEKVGGGWVQKKYPSPLQRRVISEGVWIKLLPNFGECHKDGINAFAHALSNSYAIHTPCDATEIATHSVCRKQDNCAVMYFFDTTSGGLGLSSGIFDLFMDLLPMVEERLLSCGHCDSDTFDKGCPACIQVPRWFEDNEHLSKDAALEILKRLKEIFQQHTPQITESSMYQHRKSGGFTAINGLSFGELDEIQKKYGLCVYKKDAVVKMRTGVRATVLGHSLEEDSLVYALQLEDGRSIRVRDMGLVLIEGEKSYLCTVCGHEAATIDIICPECGSELF